MKLSAHAERLLRSSGIPEADEPNGTEGAARAVEHPVKRASAVSAKLTEVEVATVDRAAANLSLTRSSFVREATLRYAKAVLSR
jgi:hypothetical protein